MKKLRQRAPIIKSEGIRVELIQILSDYEKMLESIKEKLDNPFSFLEVILQRDRIARLVETQDMTADMLLRLINADQLIRISTRRFTSLPWQAWRQSFLPSPSRWWWFLDQEIESWEEKKHLPLIILTGLMVTITISLTIDMIQRMWASGPDLTAVAAATLSVALTASPLTQRGRDLAVWLFDQTHFPVRWRSYSFLLASSLALIIVLVIRLSLPGLALFYNNQGVIALQRGDLYQARQLITRAAELNPDYAVAYYNLANAYLEIGDVDQAVNFFQKSLASDRKLDVGYVGLGNALLLEMKPRQAIRVLYHGLDSVTDDATRSALWTNLGWAYIQLNSPMEAKTSLENALNLNSKEPSAHCALGLVSEELQADADQVTLHWENCLRYSDSLSARGRELSSLAQAHLLKIKEKK